MPSLSKDRMLPILQVVKSMDYETWAPIVDKRVDDATERLVMLLRPRVSEEHRKTVMAALSELVKTEIAGALLEAIKVQREEMVPVSKGKIAKADKGREISRWVDLLNRDGHGKGLTYKELQPLIKAERVRNGLPGKISESTISRHLSRPTA